MKQFAKSGFAVILQAFLMGLALHAPASAAVSGTLTLKAAVQVASEEVTLGDLVATSDASFPSAMVICHAPVAGSVRTLTVAEVEGALKRQEANYRLRGAEQISVSRAGHTISAADLMPLIETGLKNNNIQARVQEIQLQAAIVVNDVSEIKLLKLRFDSAVHKYRASFAAAGALHSVPFEAMVMLDAETAPTTISTAKKDVSLPRAAALVHRGDHAAMLLEGDGFSATLMVVCLENGPLAKEIRVRDTETKHIYRAQITGQGTLRATGREN